LAGYTGFVNFVHLKPSITLHPAKTLKIMLAAAGQWRETTADAVYTQPNIPVAGTAGRPGRYTGTYGQVRADWALTPHYSVALEAVHFAVAQVIRQAGGHDSNYVGAEFKFGW
jgi:Alginate export